MSNLSRRFLLITTLFCVALFAGLAAINCFYGAQAATAVGLLVLSVPTAIFPPTHILGTTTLPILTDERPGDFFFLPVAAATKIPAGVIVATDSNGRAVNATDVAAIRVVGRAEETIDNTSGAAGDLSINIRRGVFRWNNSSGSAITAAMVGKQCYVEDNQTVAASSTNKVVAGRIFDLDSVGVWVDTRRAGVSTAITDNSTGTASSTIAAGAGVSTIALPLVLSKIGAAAVLSAYVPGYAFKILSATVAVTSPVTTGAKAATLTPQITGVNVTGGVLALTSANLTPLGALVAGTAITAANTGSAIDSISVIGSAVTAFVEGEAVLLLKVQNMDTANAIASLAALNL